jgi:hypothetical protein
MSCVGVAAEAVLGVSVKSFLGASSGGEAAPEIFVNLLEGTLALDMLPSGACRRWEGPKETGAPGGGARVLCSLLGCPSGGEQTQQTDPLLHPQGLPRGLL